MNILAPLYTENGEKIGEIQLPGEIFGIKPKKHVLWEVVKSYLANQRQGTHKAKRRGEVKGSGRKIWPQKHTGRARHGDAQAPIFVGGGKAHPPEPRDYSYYPPKKVRKLALKMALSDRAMANRILVFEKFMDDEIKTKNVYELLRKMELINKKILFLTHNHNKNFYLSSRNIEKVLTKPDFEVTTYDVLNSDYILMEKMAIEGLKERLK